VTPCDSSPCMNGGQCTVIGSNYSCSCTDGFSGHQCQGTLDFVNLNNIYFENYHYIKHSNYIQDSETSNYAFINLSPKDYVRSCLIQLFKWGCSYISNNSYETEFVP